MDMTGERRIAASRQAVWAALNDANVLKQCIPGCESLEKLSDTEMTAKVTVGIGPVHASFTGRVELSGPERLLMLGTVSLAATSVDRAWAR